MVFPIRNDNDYERALARVDELWGTATGTETGDELDVWLVLVAEYESKHHRLPPGDPVDILDYKRRELGWKPAEMAMHLGWTRGRVSEVLRRKRPLTLAMIRTVVEVMGVPAEALLGGHAREDHVWVRLPEAMASAASLEAATRNLTLDHWVQATVRSALAPTGESCTTTLSVERRFAAVSRDPHVTSDMRCAA